MNDWDDWVEHTPAGLVRMRESAAADIRLMAGVEPIFTCDTCFDQWRCPYVFDIYNTDGDCLASK